jgi:hypothetical protein
MEYKGLYNLDENSYRGLSYDLRPTVLKRDSPSSFSAFPQPDVYRSLSAEYSSELESDGLRPTPLYRSSTDDSTLSRPDYRSIIDSGHSSSDILPPPKHIIPSKVSPFVPRVSPIDDLQSSFLVRDLPKEPPPVPGGYLEPSYHFISRSKPSSLLDAIPKAIVAIKTAVCYGIDFDVIPQKYKVKCVAYPLGEPKLPFVCRVFFVEPDDKGKRYALEFQRRSGCVMQFSDLWAKCKRYFQETGLLITDKSSPPLKTPLPKIDVQVTEEQTRDTLKCLLQMATSKCCDVKSQAVAALCKMSTEEQQQALMLEEEGCLEAFIAAASCPDEDIHRCAVSALANLAHNRAPVCRKIAEKDGVQRLCTLSTSNTKEIVRESLRALLSLTQSLGSRILDDGCQRVMETHRDSHDPYTQQAVLYLTKLSV